MFNKTIREQVSDRRIIKVVGDALEKEEENGNVGVYPYAGQIVLWDMVKREDVERVEAKIDSLLKYLKLEYFSELQENIIRKKAKPNA